MTTTKATTNMVRAMTKQAQPIKVRAMRPTLTMACTATMMMRSYLMTTVLHWAVTQQYHEMTQSSTTTTSRQKLTTTVTMTMTSKVETMTATTTRTMFANLLTTITRVATSTAVIWPKATTKTTLRHSKSKVLYHEVNAGTVNMIVQSMAITMSVTTRPRTRTMKMTLSTVIAARTKVADKARTTTTTTTMMRILGNYSTY